MAEHEHGGRANLETALAYIEALGQLHDEVIREEFPSRLVPSGARHARHARRSFCARRATRFESALQSGQLVTLELEWCGVMQTSLGPLCEGQALRAASAAVFEFNGGRIERQRNYDCYCPF